MKRKNEKRKAGENEAKVEGGGRGCWLVVCGVVDRLNEPEKQPTKPQGEDLTHDQKQERVCAVCGKALSHEAESGARWAKKLQLQPNKPLATNQDLEREDARRRESRLH